MLFTIVSLIISLLIPLLILGPFFTDLIVSLSSLIFLIYVFRHKIFFYFNKKPIIIFFIFCAYCILISIFMAEDVPLSLGSSLFYFRIGIFSCFIWFLIERDKRIINYVYYALIISFLALVIDGYYQFIFGHNIFGVPKFADRVSSFFGDELIMGSYLSRLFPLLFALFVIRENYKYENYFIAILFILIDLLIFISGERVAFLFLNLSTFFVIILIKKMQNLRLWTFIISIFLIAFVTFVRPDVKNRMITSTLKLTNNAIFSEGHENYLRTAFNMFKDKPVFGHGPKMFRVICKDPKYAYGAYPCNTHPHNFYVQLLAETGIVGFMFLFSLFIYVIYSGIRQFKTIVMKEKRYLSDYQICLLACILITVWPFSPNGNFFNNWLAICYSLPFGFYFHSIYGKNKDKISKN